ncbi:29672_t:CDS:2, partial [Gigaspora margarita]
MSLSDSIIDKNIVSFLHQNGFNYNDKRIQNTIKEWVDKCFKPEIYTSLGSHYHGKKFENNVRNFVTEIGGQAAITKVLDNGFDITVTFDRINVVMQLKYHYISSGKKVSIKVDDVCVFVGAFETQYRNSDFYGIFLTNSSVTFSNECQNFKNSYKKIHLYTVDNLFNLLCELNQAHSTVTFDNSLVSMEAMGIETVILEFNNIKVQYQNV